MTAQLELERSLRGEEGVPAFHPGPKTILVHLQDDGTVDDRLEAALSLGRAYSAHLECLHVTPIQAYVAFDNLGGVFVMNKVFDALEEQDQALRAKIETKMGSEDVSWSYSQVTGDIPNQLIGHASLADLMITGREPQRSDYVGSTIGLLGDLISRSRTPLFIPGENGKPVDPTGPAVIAWDGSYEAANAVRASIGLLQCSSSVEVVQVAEQKEQSFPSTRLLAYLSRHDVHAELTLVPPATSPNLQEDVSDILRDKALSMGAGYLVMGGYNHSRIGEYIFGGVTRSLLSACPVPIIVSR